jgi:hypothetical protein
VWEQKNIITFNSKNKWTRCWKFGLQKAGHYLATWGVNQSANQSVNQPASQTVSQSISQPDSQSVSQSVSHSLTPSLPPSLTHSVIIEKFLSEVGYIIKTKLCGVVVNIPASYSEGRVPILSPEAECADSGCFIPCRQIMRKCLTTHHIGSLPRLFLSSFCSFSTQSMEMIKRRYMK